MCLTVLMSVGDSCQWVNMLQKPIAYSNVALIDPVTKAACRSRWRYLEDGTKVSAYSLNQLQQSDHQISWLV